MKRDMMRANADATTANAGTHVHAEDSTRGNTGAQTSDLAVENTKLRRARRELEATRDRYMELFALAPIAHIVIDSHDRIVELNLAAAKLLGSPRRALIRQRLADFVSAPHVPRYNHYRQHVFATRNLERIELVLKRPDGSERAVQLQGNIRTLTGKDKLASIVLNESKQILSVLEAAPPGEASLPQEVTRRERAEDDLRRARELLHSVIHHSQDGIFTIDSDGFVETLNGAAERILGVAMNEVRGRNILDFIRLEAIDGSPLLLPHLARRAPQGGRQAVVGQRPDGTGFHADLMVHPIKDFPLWSCILHDRTDQKAAEILIRDERERTRAILDSAADAIITSDADGLIEFVNPSTARMFGYTFDELIGRNLMQLFVGAGKPPTFETIEQIPVDQGLEVLMRRKDGTSFPAFMTLSRILFRGRKALCGFVRDLTEVKKTEEQLRHAQKMEAVGTLASGVAHDFNNLLMGISGCANISLEILDPDNSARLYIEEIRKSADCGAAITRQLLTFGRKSDAKSAVFELNDVIASEERFLRRLLGEDIDLRFDMAAADSRVRLDVGQAEQILMNLAVNARDAMPKGGRLEVRTELMQLTDENRGKLEAGHYVALLVTDEGCGIPAEITSRIFEPFYTSKELGKGTGLGLSTVYAIAKQAGGGVFVRSEVGVGTTFTTLLPLAQERITLELPAPDHQNIDLDGNETILVVEDDPMVSLAVRHYLQRAGYRVLDASSGPEAIECCLHFHGPIDLLLTDMSLPGLSGDEIAKHIREIKPGIQVLCMSAHSPETLAQRGQLQEVAGALQKPFEEEHLLAAVRRVLVSASPDILPRSGSLQDPPRFLGSVLFVQQERQASRSLKKGLRRLGYEVLEAADVEDAMRQVTASESSFSAVVFDASVAATTATAVARGALALCPDALVLCLDGAELQEPSELADVLRIAQTCDAHRLHAILQQARKANPAPSIVPLNYGTILVVEESKSARLAIVDHLSGQGWETYEASSGYDACAILRISDTPFDVLLASHSIPDMSCEVLARRFSRMFPTSSVVYMSGLGRLEVDPPGNVLSKPISLDALAARMHQILASRVDEGAA